MGADDHARGGFLARQASTHREAAADALGGGHDVRNYVVMLVAIKVSGARDAALNLVEHQHQIVLVARGAEAGEELVRPRADSALALDRLDQEASRILVDRSKRRIEVVELYHLEAGEQRREAVDHLGLIGRADRSHAAAVKGVRKADQVMLVRVALGVMIAAGSLDRA